MTHLVNTVIAAALAFVFVAWVLIEFWPITLAALFVLAIFKALT